MESAPPDIMSSMTATNASDAMFREFIEFFPDAVFLIYDHQCIFANTAGARLFGLYSVDDLLGKDLRETVYSEDRRKVFGFLAELLEGKKTTQRTELRIVRADGSLVHVDGAACVITYENRRTLQLFARDITEQKQTEAHLRYLAYYDTLTGLPNMAFFFRQLREAMEQDAESTVITLECISEINPIFGRTIGDQVLQLVTACLQEAVLPFGLVASTSGNEFAILLHDVGAGAMLDDITHNIIQRLRQPLDVEGYSLHIATHLGIASYQHDDTTAEELVKNADLARYCARRDGAAYSIFTDEISTEMAQKRLVEQHLQRAIEQNELLVYFQPQINLATMHVYGAEALVRWQHPHGGLVMPDQFISIAEDMGLIEAIDEWVLRQACRYTRLWRDAGYADFRIAVNLSARQFLRYDLLEMVTGILRETGLPPQALELEITETTAMKDIDRSLKVLSEFKQLGVRIAIDDFGTGYSSLDYLKRFPASTLKIPRVFIKDMLRSPDYAAIVEVVIKLAHILQLDALAEGVEQADELAFLRTCRCDIIQGYYFSKPLPWDAFERFLEKYYVNEPATRG